MHSELKLAQQTQTKMDIETKNDTQTGKLAKSSIFGEREIDYSTKLWESDQS